MLTLVYGEFALRHASMFAFIAGEWALFRMHATLVRVESVAFGASKFAFIAGEWTLTSMCAFMPNQFAASHKSMVALVADKWALA